ncbi:MAG: TIGR02301 family protein [Pseudomonadota bacterium]|nr:TIGR02301 family protein [Pseudomonadota bacterium]
MRALTVILCLCLLPIAAEAQKPQRGDSRAIDLRTNQTFRDSPTDQSRQRENRFDDRRDDRRDRRDFRQDEPAEPSVDVERILPYLAYTLGELHYLDYACSGNEAQVWREQMIALLAMEASESRGRRDQLIDSFNEGYRVQQRFRAVCGPQVEAERRALAHRGRDLSELMRSAYFD